MELHNRDFMNTPPMKTVRFGGTVADTLAKYKKGDLSDYELLRHQLADPDIKDAQIVNWLQEFRSCVTLLSKEHEQLIHAVLRLPWVGRSQPVVEEYLSFLSNLVSAQTVYLCSCLRAVVGHFIPKRVTVSEGGVDFSDSDDEDENLPRNFEHCHQALQLISRYVPSTGRFLTPILQEKFPFIQKSPRTLECYVHNLLRVTVYVPSVRRDVLEIIVDKMLQLDVSASRTDIEEAEESAVHQHKDEALFDMDEDLPAPPSSCIMAHPVADRLDTLMAVLLAFIKDVCHVNGALQLDQTKELYRDLLWVFDKVILPTHACSHVQYSLFYLCSFRLALSEAFLEHLWRLVQNPTQAAVLRQAALGYMGSFLARAKFIPIVTVRACLDLLVSWIHSYLDSQDSVDKQFCDLDLHGPFYSACQAVFYTLVFRHRAILEGNMKRGLEYLQSLNLERMVMCQLNPLKVCLPTVTHMFAVIMRRYQVVFCYTVIERNNRQMLPVIRSSTGGDRVVTNTNPLDCFFPFDPYLLKRSGAVIQPLYQVWEEPADSELHTLKTKHQASQEDEDDFLSGETPKDRGIVLSPPPVGQSLVRAARTQDRTVYHSHAHVIAFNIKTQHRVWTVMENLESHGKPGKLLPVAFSEASLVGMFLRKRGTNSMNRDEGAYTLSHTWDSVLEKTPDSRGRKFPLLSGKTVSFSLLTFSLLLIETETTPFYWYFPRRSQTSSDVFFGGPSGGGRSDPVPDELEPRALEVGELEVGELEVGSPLLSLRHSPVLTWSSEDVSDSDEEDQPELHSLLGRAFTSCPRRSWILLPPASVTSHLDNSPLRRGRRPREEDEEPSSKRPRLTDEGNPPPGTLHCPTPPSGPSTARPSIWAPTADHSTWSLHCPTIHLGPSTRPSTGSLHCDTPPGSLTARPLHLGPPLPALTFMVQPTTGPTLLESLGPTSLTTSETPGLGRSKQLHVPSSAGPISSHD
ncbi:hypothetical protein WMY93_001904 [Mugilogobius chulae]|uniref:RNA polymerase I-specific transcription initiation factor RRN3 n=1 Tax=Mugilogobius chulae TaxID=88201 RepID=A0AAW0PTA5_9GOBI